MMRWFFTSPATAETETNQSCALAMFLPWKIYFFPLCRIYNCLVLFSCICAAWLSRRHKAFPSFIMPFTLNSTPLNIWSYTVLWYTTTKTVTRQLTLFYSYPAQYHSYWQSSAACAHPFSFFVFQWFWSLCVLFLAMLLLGHSFGLLNSPFKAVLLLLCQLLAHYRVTFWSVLIYMGHPKDNLIHGQKATCCNAYMIEPKLWRGTAS